LIADCTDRDGSQAPAHHADRVKRERPVRPLTPIRLVDFQLGEAQRAGSLGTGAGMESWMPEMTLHEVDGRCRLTLRGLTSGQGQTLQEAADDLVRRLVTMARTVQRRGLVASTSMPLPDVRLMSFLYDVAACAGEDEDVREHVLRGIPKE
jgi:hypothetical protein